MGIKLMHYNFNRKFNKIDSQRNRNIKVQEKDQYLNEALEIFVALIAEPRMKNYLGFETSQRSIDDIRTLVTTACSEPSIGGIVTLTDDYWYFVKAESTISREGCEPQQARVLLKQHDDRFEESPFDKSSFEWREVTAVFTQLGLQTFTDGTFTVDDVCITYIRKPPFMHNAEDAVNGTYALPGQPAFTGIQECELPESTQREIVDIAVLLASGEVQASDFQLKLSKLKLNQLT